MSKINWRKLTPTQFLVVFGVATAAAHVVWVKYCDYMLEQAPKDPKRARSTIFFDTKTADIMMPHQLQMGDRHIDDKKN